HAFLPDRGRDHQRSGLHPGRGLPVVPGRGHPGADGVVGQHADGGAERARAALVPLDSRARLPHLPDRAGVQLSGGRAVRRPEPAQDPRRQGRVRETKAVAGSGDKNQGSVQPVLEVRDLRTHFFTDDGVVKAVNGVSFQVYPGETLGVVGESGCGKSVTALSILRLIASPPGRIVGGQILYKGKDLVTASEAEMRKIRGNEISMIFQEPMTSLNPV